MAFPTTSALDTFTRANEDPLTGNWARLVYATTGLQLISNVAVGHVGAGSASYWLAASYGASSEAWGTLATKWTGDSISMYVITNVQSAGVGSSEDFYLLGIYGSSGDVMEVYRVDNEVPTLLGATVTGLTITAGDKLGLENIGGTLKGYQFNGGAWNLRVTRTDTTYGAGNIGMGADNNTVSIDDFGGGTVVPGATMGIIFRNQAYV